MSENEEIVYKVNIYLSPLIQPIFYYVSGDPKLTKKEIEKIYNEQFKLCMNYKQPTLWNYFKTIRKKEIILKRSKGTIVNTI